MFKKYKHENGGELIVQDAVQEAALLQEGFKFVCEVEKDKDGNLVDIKKK